MIARRDSLPVGLVWLGAGSIWCWRRISALGDVRLHLAAFYGWFALAFVGYLASLWLIRRREQAVASRRAVGLGLGVIGVVAIVARLLLLGTAPTLSDDLYRYRWDGRVQLAGIDPYAYPPNAPALAPLRDALSSKINFPHLRTVYPPLTQLAFRMGAMVGPGLTAQKEIFVSAELLTIASLLCILARRKRSLLWIAAYAWHPLSILEIAGSGHNDALGIGLLWLGLAALEARRWAGAALSWAAAFLSKFGSAVLIPWWWMRRQARGWLWISAALAALPLLACFSCVTAVVESLSAMAARFESNASVYLLLAWMTQSAALARLAAFGLLGLFAIWWARRQVDPIAYLLGALSVAALLSPVLHPWYVVWLIPCFCFYRVPALMALSGTVVLAYTVWPGRLADGHWAIPVWAHVLEYTPVFILALYALRMSNWGLRTRCASQ